jgi:iron complex outermembrane receptor protein
MAPSAMAQGNTQVAAADQPAGLETVIVSAEKRDTDLQKTPIAISVMSPEAMADRHVTSLLDLNDGSIPGLRVATFEARQSALTIGIRGIVPLDANQPAREQGVGVYIDGVYLGRQHGLNAALMDVERIEVLKGPQGTLFGRNTEGGALSIVTRAPTGEFGVRSTWGVGNYGISSGEVHIDFPEFLNISTKLDGIMQHQNATTKNPLAGQTGWNFYDRKGVHFSARWQPIDEIRVDYSYDYSRDENSPFYSQLLNYNPLGLPIGPASGTLPAGTIRPLPPGNLVKVAGDYRMPVADIGVPQQPSVDLTSGHSVRANWSVLDNLEIRSITALRTVTVYQWDNAGGAHRIPAYTPGGAFSRYSLADLWQHQFSQEFQAVGNLWGRVDYVGGLYYFAEKVGDDAATPSSNTWNANSPLGYTINDPTPTLPGFRSIDRASTAWSKSMAVYGQATYTPPILDDTLHVTVGGRWTNDKKKGNLYKVSNANTNFSFLERNNRFNPMVTVAWDAMDDVNVYAKYSTGYRAGGASSRSLTYRSFGPEDVVSYEIGAKTEFLGMFRVNAAIYTMDRTGSQIDFNLVTVTGSSTRNTLETINAPGTTKISGVELEGTALITENLTVGASYAYTFTKIPPTVNPFNNLVQPVFIVFTPENAYSASADYTYPLSFANLRLHIDGNYADATQTFDQTPVTNDAQFLMNARIALADIDLPNHPNTGLTISFWVRNMWDNTFVYRRDPANRSTLGDYGNLNAPRTFGLEAALKL